MTAAHVVDFASAFATFLDTPGPVVLARDPRSSGVMIREGVVSALLACGRDVLDLGVASTPVLQHAIRRSNAAGGISIGASHNAAEWNALKFFGAGGSYLSTAQASELLDIYHLHRFDFVPWDRLGKLCRSEGAIDAYADELAAHFDMQSLRGVRIVADCCNGTSSLILRLLRDRFGLDAILINEKTEGVDFAHEPATNRAMVDLQLAPLIRPLNAAAGFLFDVDSDRVALATDQGQAISEEMVLPIIADYLIPRGAGKLVITNLSTTALVEHVAARHGGRVIRVPVGRQSTIDALSGYRPEQIAVAGEGTGAVMMPQFRFVYDGIASMLAVLAMMRESGRKLSEIVAGYPKYFILKGQVELVSQRIPALLMDLRERYSAGKANIEDGLRVDWEDRWFHVRVSQTEPAVRVICEQRGKPPDQLFENLVDYVRSFA
jgi:phosphomannomutase